MTVCDLNMLGSCIGSSNTYVSYYDTCASCFDYTIVLCESMSFICHCAVADDYCLHVSRQRPTITIAECDSLPINVLDKAGSRVRWVLHIAQFW